MDREQQIERLEELGLDVERGEIGIWAAVFIHDALIEDFIRLVELNERIAHS